VIRHITERERSCLFIRSEFVGFFGLIERDRIEWSLKLYTYAFVTFAFFQTNLLDFSGGSTGGGIIGL
jgi:hypothetical protein